MLATTSSAVVATIAVGVLALAAGVLLGRRRGQPAGDVHVAALRADLARVEQSVHALGRLGAEQYGRIDQAVHEQARATQLLATTADGLHRALASPTVRGQWGERMVDDVLRLAGFVEHVNYRRRTAISGDGTGGRGVPDITILLPQDRVLHLDVKFPITAYLRCQQATTDAERAAHRAQFLRDVRDRVKELARRDYWLDPGTRSVDHVLLFIPNEALLAFVYEHDPQLVDDALGQHVVLCSPLTLYTHLAVVRQAVEQFAVREASEQILALLDRFDDQWRKYQASIELVSRRVDAVQRELAELAGPRRRGLERPLAEVAALRRTRMAPAAQECS